jgi:hypothetical protein
MAKDFLSGQIRTNKIIGSGSSSPKLIIYPDNNALDNVGGIPETMLTGLGEETFLYVHGSKCGVEHSIPNSVAVFGGDVVIKGKLYAEKSDSSLWSLDIDDNDNLVPTNILDGDTGLFGLDLNLMLDGSTLQTSQYTMTNRDSAVDKYFEFDSEGNVMPRDIDAEMAECQAELDALNN